MDSGNAKAALNMPNKRVMGLWESFFMANQ